MPEPVTLQQIWNEEREILDCYLTEYTDTVMVFLDREQRLLDCNQGFLKVLDVTAKPLGRHLQEFLTRESQDALKRFPEAGGYREIRLNFVTRAGFNTLTARIFGTSRGTVIFGEKPWPTSSEIMAKISVLNNELANLAREVQKKNRALERANAVITQLMRTDPLTGLANRRFLMETLGKEISLAHRHQLPLCLVITDLDHFKNINDTYGHDAGDRVLKAFAALLQQQTRKEDLPARLGGEEFTIILPHTTLGKGLTMAERMRQELASLHIPGIDVQVTASFGISKLLLEDDPDSFIQRTDAALYRAKAQGRNRVVAESPVVVGLQTQSNE